MNLSASQQTQNTYAYDPYGKLMAQTEAIAQPFKYAGQVGIMDEGNNLYYMRARYYDGNLGRFVLEDPAGFVDGPNLYAYVGGNPVMAVDPSGLDYLVANGGVLTHYYNNGIVAGTYPYTSGRNGSTDPSIPNQGPIPPGTYSLDPKQISEGGFIRNLLGDWGHYRAPLTPSSSTNSYGRDGFFLHGGNIPGSAGCIDIGSGDKTLFPNLSGHNGPVPVIAK